MRITAKIERYDPESDEEASKCIMCGACTSSCPSRWADPDYLGSAAFVKAFRYVFDSRDEGAQKRRSRSCR